MSGDNRVVLIAVDGSDVSEQAFRTYVDVLRRADDKVVLFTCVELKHVFNSFWKETVYRYDPELMRGKLDKEQEEAKAIQKPLVERLQELKMNHIVITVVAKDPGEEIVQTARRERADLIVMGCRGRNIIRRSFMGSCSDYVINHTTIPVVCCRKE